MAKVAACLAEGFEETEALAVIDILRRAKIDVTLVAVMGKKEVTSSHRVTVVADDLIENINFDEYDMIFLPGGMPGTTNLAACEKLQKAIVKFNEKQKYLAAICAAPTVYGQLGLLKGRKACCYPGMEDKLLEADVSFEKVEVSEHFITSRGLGTAIELGLTLVEIFQGKEAAENIGKSIVYL